MFITNSDSFQNYDKSRQKLLQITVGITNCGVITNCVATVMSIITKTNALKRSNVEVQTEVKKLVEAFLVLREKGNKVKRSNNSSTDCYILFIFALD